MLLAISSTALYAFMFESEIIDDNNQVIQTDSSRELNRCQSGSYK